MVNNIEVWSSGQDARFWILFLWVQIPPPLPIMKGQNMAKVQFIDHDNVRVLVEENDTILHMSHEIFDHLQKILDVNL